jgi:hypothetical protein
LPQTLPSFFQLPTLLFPLNSKKNPQNINHQKPEKTRKKKPYYNKKSYKTITYHFAAWIIHCGFLLY